jgi:hypothetical protein
MAEINYIPAVHGVVAIGSFGSVELSDDWPLSGIGIQWQLSGDEYEDRTVATRPLAVTRVSPNQPVNRSQILELEVYKAVVGDIN